MHKCAYSGHRLADGEWDPRKAAENFKKHRVDFADAATVLHDERAITVRDDEGDQERTSIRFFLPLTLVSANGWGAICRSPSARPAT